VIHLRVWLRPPVGEPILAGEIVVADPDTANNREHVLQFGTVGNTPTLNSLNVLGRQFGIAAGAVKNIMNEVREAIEQFPHIGDEYGSRLKR